MGFSEHDATEKCVIIHKIGRKTGQRNRGYENDFKKRNMQLIEELSSKIFLTKKYLKDG